MIDLINGCISVHKILFELSLLSNRVVLFLPQGVGLLLVSKAILDFVVGTAGSRSRSWTSRPSHGASGEMFLISVDAFEAFVRFDDDSLAGWWYVVVVCLKRVRMNHMQICHSGRPLHSAIIRLKNSQNNSRPDFVTVRSKNRQLQRCRSPKWRCTSARENGRRLS